MFISISILAKDNPSLFVFTREKIDNLTGLAVEKGYGDS
jgi:hypothetical protein